MAPPIPTQLVEAVMAGDQAALGRLLEMHEKPMFNICLRMLGNHDDAAEVTQEAMLKIVEHIKDFNGQSQITTWMTRIAINLSLSRLRRRKVRKTVSMEGGNNIHEDQTTTLRQELADHREPAPDSRVEQSEMLEHLQEAMNRLAEDFRAVLVLRDIQQMEYQEVAQVMGVPIGTIKSRLFRARLALRHEMLRLNPPATRAASPKESSSHG
jgi:RNA polymerase sigma-70 factor (ECF subfamily)